VTNQPWLSIVTIVKDDREGFIRTVTSLLEQDLTGVEFVVVDSSINADEIDELCERIGVREYIEHLQLVRMKPEGIYAAMNRGLWEVNGRYCYFLNAGDEFADSGVLSEIQALMRAHKPSWLFGRVSIIGLDDHVSVTPLWDYESERHTGFSAGNFPSHQATVVKTELLQDVGGFDTSFHIAADYNAFLKVSEHSDPEILDNVIARFHEGGASTRGWAKGVWEFHRARRNNLSLSGIAATSERIRTVRQFLALGAYRSPWPLTAALAGLTWLVMVAWAVPAWTALLLTVFVAAQGIAGAAWWRVLQPQRSVSVLELVGMGLGLGTAGAMLTGLVGAWWALPAIAIVAWAIRRSRGPLAVLLPFGRPEAIALLLGLVPGLVAFAWTLRSYPLTWVGSWTGYHGDMPFFEALSTSVARLGPGASIFMQSGSLRYHSLAYGWAGEMSEAASAGPFVVLTRLLPLVMLIGLVAIGVAWTRNLSKSRWAPSLAALLLVTGGFVGATFGGVLNFDSPSQSVGAVWLMALSVLFIRVLSGSFSPWFVLPLAALSIALTGGKVSSAAIAAVGIGAVVIIGLLRGSAWRWNALIAATTVALAMGGTYLWLLAGSANAGGLELFSLLDRASSVQSLNPVITPRGIAAGIAILGLAILPRWAGLIWLAIDPNKRWQPSTIYGAGLAAGALGALVILSGGFNDLWFAVAASAPLAVLSAVGAAEAVGALETNLRKRVLAAVIGGLVIAVFVALIWTTGSSGIIGNGWRWAGPIVGIVGAIVIGTVLARSLRHMMWRGALALTIIALISASVPSKVLYGLAAPFAQAQEGSMSTVLFELEPDYIETIDRDRTLGWTDTQSAAAQWLRENAAPDDLLATNLTLSALVPALTGRTTYISDIHMQAPYGRAGDVPEIQRREAESWAFIDAPSGQTIEPLCTAGVRWVWVDPGRTSNRDWEPFADIVLLENDVVVLELRASACP